MKLSEREVTKQIIDFLRAEGWYCIRLQSGLFQRPGSNARTRIGEPGMADWLAIYHIVPSYGKAVVWFLEFKATGRIASEMQDRWLQERRYSGYFADCFSRFEDFLVEYETVKIHCKA